MSQILGQPRALQTLRAALRSGRFHHAWIFSGPKGVGKFTTALETARVLLDPELGIDDSALADQAPTANGFFALHNPKSKSQNLIDSNTHPDLHIIRKELALYSDDRQLREKKQTNIPIDLLRERIIGGKVGDIMHEAIAYRTAAYGHGKIFIIDEAELLAREAQNAMLKTLEEPPPQTWFFLITNQPERLYTTIHSRSQHVRFGRLDDLSMRAWVKQSGFKADAKSLEWALAFAEGSPGIAQLALEYGFFEWHKMLEPMLADLARGRFPIALGETLGAIVEAFAIAWVKAHKNASKDAANREGTRHVLTLLASHLRRQLADAARQNHDPHALLQAADLLREAERQIESHVSHKLALENLIVQWSQTPAITAA